MKFPGSIKDINVLEMNNNILVNVLPVEDKDAYICRKQRPALREINLMLICEKDRWHYTAIKSLSRLLTSRNTKHSIFVITAYRALLQGFTLELSRDEHFLTASIMKQ